MPGYQRKARPSGLRIFDLRAVARIARQIGGAADLLGRGDGEGKQAEQKTKDEDAHFLGLHRRLGGAWAQIYDFGKGASGASGPGVVGSRVLMNCARGSSGPCEHSSPGLAA